MRYLGIDPGGKRIGVAVGDDLSGVVSPVAVLPYRGVHTAARDLLSEMERRAAGIVVIGLPTGVDGAETPACRRSHLLAEALAEIGVVTVFQPEYLTTSEARERARRCGRRAGEPIDDLAALVLLEEFLGEQQNNRGSGADRS